MTYPVAQLITDSSFHQIRTDLAENAIKTALQNFTITTVDAAQIREFIAEPRAVAFDAHHRIAETAAQLEAEEPAHSRDTVQD